MSGAGRLGGYDEDRDRRYLQGTPPPAAWNHYESAKNKLQKTNNASEGWHNRFRLVVGKHHPDLYSCIVEFQKEQAFTETCLSDLALGKRIKGAPKQQWVMLQERIQDIVTDYDTYKLTGTELDYLRTLGHNVVIS